MQIIFVDRRLSRARTLDISRGKLAMLAAGLGLSIVLAVIGLYAITFRAAVEFRLPIVHDLVALAVRDEVARNEQFVRDNVAAMARKLGEMQAQLLRLDALGERVAKIAGIRPEEFNFRELPGRGGAITSDARSMTMEELQHALDQVARSVDHRTDYMDIVESEFLSTQVRQALLPRNTPVSEGFIGSRYGMRTDPFTGQVAMHSGVDFAAPTGTPIFAAAGGVVTVAEKNPVYGNMVEVDHGNDLRTRYAHASKLLVKAGDIVKRGQKLAEVGSTGRSTGPHLHFEVHVKGVPQNPSKFLIAQKPGSPLGDLAATKPAPQRATKPRRKAEPTAAPVAAASPPTAPEPAAAPKSEVQPVKAVEPAPENVPAAPVVAASPAAAPAAPAVSAAPQPAPEPQPQAVETPRADAAAPNASAAPRSE